MIRRILENYFHIFQVQDQYLARRAVAYVNELRLLARRALDVRFCESNKEIIRWPEGPLRLEIRLFGLPEGPLTLFLPTGQARDD